MNLLYGFGCVVALANIPIPILLSLTLCFSFLTPLIPTGVEVAHLITNSKNRVPPSHLKDEEVLLVLSSPHKSVHTCMRMRNICCSLPSAVIVRCHPLIAETDPQEAPQDKTKE